MDGKRIIFQLERDVVRVACCLMLWKKYVILPKTLIVDQFRHLLDSSIQTRQALKLCNVPVVQSGIKLAPFVIRQKTQNAR
uniref:Uncharacterized protein n=1 Tax=Anopheles dirus TaxID=7168 RepID=A0A182NDG4_9DIPT